jgi:hypothetical protein
MNLLCDVFGKRLISKYSLPQSDLMFHFTIVFEEHWKYKCENQNLHTPQELKEAIISHEGSDFMVKIRYVNMHLQMCGDHFQYLL